jgi:DNA topoisomerase-1
VRTLGAHPKDGEAIMVKKGRFGPYVQHGKVVANLPRQLSMDDITLEAGIALLAEKGRELKPKPGARGRAGAKAKTGGKTAKAGTAEPAATKTVPAKTTGAKTVPAKKKGAATKAKKAGGAKATAKSPAKSGTRVRSQAAE